MKGIRNLLIGTVLGAVMGWALGFLRLPYIEKNNSFWLGFAACLAGLAFLVAILFVWNKHPVLIRLIGKSSANKSVRSAKRTYAIIWIFVFTFIVLGAGLSVWMISRQKSMFESQSQLQEKRIQEQAQLLESLRKSNQLSLMGNVLDKVDEELKNSAADTLNDATISRIAALAYSYRPYRYYRGDSLSKNKLSPERGRLLLALSKMNIDSGSFIKIKLAAPFFGADLREADLKGADLSGVDLRAADLKGANLTGANLKEADLRAANLWAANLNEAILNRANLKRADLRWAELNTAKLKLADLNGANLNSAKLRKADLTGATVQYADLSGAMLNETNLVAVDLSGTVLVKANLNKANLSRANLRLVDLTEGYLTDVELDSVSVDNSWEEKLKEWQIRGTQEILETYKVVDDTTKRYNGAKFRLEKK